MRRETQKGEDTPFPLRIRSAKALRSRQSQCDSMRAGAIQDSQFQKGEQAATTGASESRAMQRSFVFFGFRISDFGFPFVASVASEARIDTERTRERTSRSCIAR